MVYNKENDSFRRLRMAGTIAAIACTRSVNTYTGGTTVKKLKIAIIGQGRSGRNIHGSFLKSADNLWYDVAYVVEWDPERRERALAEYPGCKVLENYTDLFSCGDVDLVVNASYSDTHYSISKDILEHGISVLVEKPMARNFYEANVLIETAKKHGVTIAVFQQTFLAPFFQMTKEILATGKIGDVKQVNIRYNGFGRRWDWQTLQAKMGGSVYNTGPHPIGLAIDFLDYSDDMQVVYSKLDTVLTSGDAEDFCKLLMTAPGKPLVDIEIHSNDAFNDYFIKVLGSKGTYQCTMDTYKMKYIADGENPEQPVLWESLKNEEGLPVYCSENLITHEETGSFAGTAFDVAVQSFYKMLYDNLTEGTPLWIKPENIAKLINVIETVHAQNPLPVKYL